MSRELRRALEEVAGRSRRVRLWGILAVCWLSWAIVASAALILSMRPGAFAPGAWPLAAIAGAALATGFGCAFAALRSDRDARGIARKIEAKFPGLGTGLLAAVEEDKLGGRGYLQAAVIRSALDHRKMNDWNRAVPDRHLFGSQFAHATTLGLFLLAFGALALRAVPGAGAAPAGTLASAGTSYEIRVEPGDVEIEKGTALLVVARFGGAVPAESRLSVEDGAHATTSLPMTRSLEDPTFAGRVESVSADLTYRVEFAGKSSGPFRVSVFEYPELMRADARLVFPQYTYMEPKTAEDIRHVTAVEGTEMTLLCRLNKEVASAKLVDEAGAETDLATTDPESHTYGTTFTLAESRRYKLKLADAQGRANKLPSEIVVNVTKNRPPAVAMTQPAHDVRVSPVEELSLKAKADDDFGVVRHGFSYSLPGGEPKEVALGDPKKVEKKVVAEHLIDFEALKAAPDQLVTYFAWAEDVGPDGKPRRVDGDMFFAEVRHFEEIFRQGEPPPSNSAEGEQQQQQGNAQQAEQLAELQKQVINGTWKVIRRETSTKLSDKFVDDSKTLRESQAEAIEKAVAMGERLQDPASKASLEQAVRFMKEAESRLGEAAEKSSLAAHKPALAAEQSAYQALLKLRARDFEVTRRNRQQQQRSASASASQSQRQLNELELSNDENRYEEQRSAQAKQQNQSQRDREQAENRQVVNRLRELSQRQNDLNERLKELQSALEAAKDEQAKREVERQLKRLREQQQQILRDTDEVRERLEREENRERMAEAREQLDQGREHVRQASEALEKGQVPQAVTEGARAGKQLNDLKEELRKESANRFSEDLNAMREQAKKLDETQEELTRKLDSPDKSSKPSLREGDVREQVAKGLERQRKDLDGLVDRMRKTVEDAEESEPLLAKELYNTVRKADGRAIPKSLDEAARLADAGIPAEAVKSARKAGQGIEELRQGVDRAARSVLGDGTAALKRAQGEVEDLADQIHREMAQATGEPMPGPDAGAPRPDRNPPAGRESAAARDQDPQPDGRPGDQGEQDPRADRPGEQPGREARGGLRGEQQNPQSKQAQRGQQGQRGQQPGAQQKQEGSGQPGQRGQQEGQSGGQAEQQGRQGQQGQQPGQQGRQPGQQGQQGQGQQSDQQGQRGQQQGDQPGQQPGPQGQQPGRQGQQGQQGGQPGRQQGPQGQQPGQRGQQGGGGGRPGGIDQVANGLDGGGPGNPITGEGFRQWSDRMRDVEELLDDPGLRAEAARIRDRVRGAREEFKRHAKEPDWKEMKGMVADPIRELRDKIAEEVRRRESPDSLVPIDRDPVPPRYAEGVRRYYERLGSGR